MQPVDPTRLSPSPFFFAVAFGCGAIFSTACVNDGALATTNADSSGSMNNTASFKPKGEDPAWGNDIDDEMLVEMEKLQSYVDKPIETVSASEARMGHTPTDPVMGVIKEHDIPTLPSNVDTMGKDIPVEGDSIHSRIHTLKTADSAHPEIVYFHGGGWVITDLDTYNASAKGLAEQTDAVVISVRYRQAPEHKVPTGHNDLFAAYQWEIKNATSIKGNPKMVAVAGESGVGKFACAISMMARDKGVQTLVHQLLVYPVAGIDMNSESYQEYAQSEPLNKPMIEWFARNYLSVISKATDPRISLVNTNLQGLPPPTIVGSENDPLQTEGKLLSDKLKDAGLDVDYKLYNGVTHEFFGMATVYPMHKMLRGTLLKV